MKRLSLIRVLALAGMLAGTSVGAESLTPVGIWLHANGRIRVEIAPCGDRLCGRIVWFKRPNDAHGRPRANSKNTDRALRTRPLLGLTVLRGLRRSGDTAWEGGEIYNPDDGTDYKASISMDNNDTLHVRAYLLFPLLGKTQIWTRVR